MVAGGCTEVPGVDAAVACVRSTSPVDATLQRENVTVRIWFSESSGAPPQPPEELTARLVDEVSTALGAELTATPFDALR